MGYVRSVGLVLMTVTLVSLFGRPATAQEGDGPSSLCFPETGQCLEGTSSFIGKTKAACRSLAIPSPGG